MNKNQSGPSVPAVLGAAVLTGFALTLALMAACALAVLMGGLPADKIALWADLCLVLGSLCAAFLAAKRSSAWAAPLGSGCRSDCVCLPCNFEFRVVW